MDVWPNFFIVGADKAGSSSLYAYLNEIPEIFMSRIKEPNYFSIKTFDTNHPIKPIRDKKKYLDLFKNVKDEKIIGEASPSYLADPDAAKLIHQVSPNAKILISVRDPVDRLFSHYLMLKRIYFQKSSFHNLLQESLNIKNNKNDKLRLNNGLYFQHVKRYFTIFPKEQIKIIIFENFIKDPKQTILEILDFLKLKKEYKDFKPEIYNKYGRSRSVIAQKILQSSKIRRVSEELFSPSKRRLLKEKLLLKDDIKPTMDKKDNDILVKYYYDDVKNIKNLLGRELPWKNFLDIKPNYDNY